MPNINLPLAAETCAHSGRYFTNAYYGYHGEIRRFQFPIGKGAPASPEDILALADRHLGKEPAGGEFPWAPIVVHKGDTLATAAATVIKLCDNHWFSRLEPVQRVVAVSDDEQMTAAGIAPYALDEMAHGERFVLDARTEFGTEPTLYMPHADVTPVVHAPHPVITVRRGGHTDPVRVALFGDEVLLPVEPTPDLRPHD